MSKIKYFRNGEILIPVTFKDDGSVNIGCTGDMSAYDFARLAASVVRGHNDIEDDWVKFPYCNDLIDREEVL